MLFHGHLDSTVQDWHEISYRPDKENFYLIHSNVTSLFEETIYHETKRFLKSPVHSNLFLLRLRGRFINSDNTWMQKQNNKYWNWISF